ncbi:MAG: ABC transporter ATP-binding protein [Chloroflexota bacterium]|nr:ABC transporter ATP-binding protein [Chloroflexota bacterium]
MSTGRSELALQIRGAGKSYGNAAVVQDLNLVVRPGEICALLGPSGCGKTTTLRLISGFEQLDTGTIIIGGRVVASTEHGQVNSLPPEQRRVGMVFQDYALFPHLSVRDNVGFGLDRNQGTAANEALALVGLETYGDRMPGQLSGGQQQRVALARALAPRPEILLMDEPFSNLDATMRARLRTEVRNILRAAGATAVLVTHDQEEAFTLADRVAIMLDGRIAQVGTPEDVYLHPRGRAVANFLGDVQYLPGKASGTHVDCVLGNVPLSSPANGQVVVVVRPEAVCLLPAESDSAQGTVRDRQFLGQSVLLSIALDAGLTITVRTDHFSAPDVSDRVGVRLRGPVHVLPA